MCRGAFLQSANKEFITATSSESDMTRFAGCHVHQLTDGVMLIPGGCELHDTVIAPARVRESNLIIRLHTELGLIQ